MITYSPLNLLRTLKKNSSSVCKKDGVLRSQLTYCVSLMRKLSLKMTTGSISLTSFFMPDSDNCNWI